MPSNWYAIVVSRRLVEVTGSLARIQQRETARAVGGFQHPRLETRLPDGRGLLVARDAADRDGTAKEIRAGFAKIGGAILDLGQHGHGDAQLVADGLGPMAFADVVEHGARGVGGVGDMNLAARQVPDDPCVDGAKGQFARLGPRANTVHVIENPSQFCAAEIGVEQQTRAVGHHLFKPFGLEPLADLGRAAVLPDDGVEHRLACGTIPDQRGFALVGDADGRDVGCAAASLFDGSAAGGGGCRPQVRRVMFDPATLRVMLGEFFLR